MSGVDVIMIKSIQSRCMGVALLLFAGAAQAASFDCTKASTPSEILICGVPELSSADAKLAEVYRRARTASANAAQLRDTARAQLRLRDATCRDVECLKGWYGRQIAYYEALLGEAPAPSTPAVVPAAPIVRQAAPSTAAPTLAPLQQAASQAKASSLQEALISIIATAQKQSRDAANDMQRGGVKAQRDRQICQLMTTLAVSDWTGRVDAVSANSDGKGVLSIEIAPDIYVKTWNNALSDMLHDTLIEPLSPVFNAASMLKKGQPVVFSGQFFRGDDGDCLYESSLTLSGKLRSPELIFRFAQVAPR